MTKLSTLKSKWLKDPKIKDIYEKQSLEFDILNTEEEMKMRDNFDGYSIHLFKDECNDFIAHFVELPNVSACGATAEEALVELKEAWEAMKESYHKHKGYYGSVKSEPISQILYGKVEYIRPLISYEGTTAEEVHNAFKAAVDDYLEICKERGVEPEKPFNGSLIDFEMQVKQAMENNPELTEKFIREILTRRLGNADETE